MYLYLINSYLLKLTRIFIDMHITVTNTNISKFTLIVIVNLSHTYYAAENGEGLLETIQVNTICGRWQRCCAKFQWEEVFILLLLYKTKQRNEVTH